MDMLYMGLINEAMAVAATTITSADDTKPAETAASPKINAPTMLMAEPMGLGSLSPPPAAAQKRIPRTEPQQWLQRAPLPLGGNT